MLAEPPIENHVVPAALIEIRTLVRSLRMLRDKHNVQFSTGTLLDVHRLREATRSVGAALMIDVTQAAGSIPIDAESWDAEVVVCGGYKWLGGHGGVGLGGHGAEVLGAISARARVDGSARPIRLPCNAPSTCGRRAAIHAVNDVVQLSDGVDGRHRGTPSDG